MIQNDALHKRGQALEDEYFRRVDEELGRRLRERLDRESSAKALAAATGLVDEVLLEHLVDAGIDATKIAGLALVPVVWVAWADGTVTSDERRAVIHASLGSNIDSESSAAQLVQHWLQERPKNNLWELWKEYATAVQASLSPSIAMLVSSAIIDQATSVAQAAGNRSGKRAINVAEQKVIDEMKAVLGR